ncbi:MAG TPA: DndE family protein [Geminicoccaceae bacterium]|jgi:hypothetical protein
MSSTAAAATPVGISDMGRMDFRTSRSGETATASIQRVLSLPYRYQPARLAIARSLGLDTQPTPVANADGKTIRGETLFGQQRDEIALWTSLVIEHAGRGAMQRRDVQELVAAHWARGAGLLWDGLRGSADPVAALASQLQKAALR